MNKTVAFLTFAKWHQRPGTGSSKIRAEWLINHWPESEVFQQGKEYRTVIFQKTYWPEYVRKFKGIKIFDLCISKDTLVFTDNGWKYASEIKVGDHVLTHQGRFQEVKKVFKRRAKTKKVKVSGLCKLNITENHPVLSYSYRYKYYENGRKVEKKDFYQKEWIKVNDLKVCKKNNSYIASIARRKWNTNKMSDDMGWFWGYYSAEGFRNKDRITFAMHKNEVEQRKKISMIIRKEFNGTPYYIENKNDFGVTVSFCSRKLSRFIRDNIFSNCKKTVVSHKGKSIYYRKKVDIDSSIVNDIFSASKETKLKFLEGYIAGDGYCNDYGGISVSSISKKLAFSVWQLFRDCGIQANMRYLKREGENCIFKHKNGKVYKGKPQWRIQLNPIEAIKFYNLTDIKRYKKCRIDYWKKLKGSGNVEVVKKDDYYLHPVRKIEDGENEIVYNFEVEEDNSYIADGIIVHNCDADWLDTVPIKEIIDNCDAVTTSTEALAEAMRQFTDKPVQCVPDRVDLNVHNVQKRHRGRAKKVCWFGYSHNAVLLDRTIPTLRKRGLKLKVISNFRPPYQKADENIRYPKKDDEFNKEVLSCDFVLMPQDDRPRGKYKSNNKTIISWSLGMPVATNPQEVERFLDPDERKKEAELRLKEVKERWNVELSVIEYKRLIANLKKNGKR